MEKTLAIVSPGFPKNEADSTCVPSLQLLVKLINADFPGLKITVIPLYYPYHNKPYKWYGNDLVPLNGKQFGKILRLFLWFKAYLYLKRIKKKTSLVGVLSFWCGESALISSWFAWNNNLPHFCWVLGQDAKKENKLIKWIRPMPEELIAVSSFTRDEFFRNHRILPRHLIPNGIDPSLFSKANLLNRNIDLLGVGSFIPLKQFEVFIGIVAKIRETLPSIRAVLCGRGPEESAIQQLIVKHNLENNLSLAGELAHHEVLQRMQQSKIFLHPSLYEGYSTVCLEALYAGCQVVSFWSGEKKQVPHWQIVQSEKEMFEHCIAVLQNENADFSSVIVHSLKDSALSIVNLYKYTE